MGCTSSKADKKPARDKQKASQEPTATSASTGTGATGTRGNDEKEAGPNSGRQEAVEENSDSGQEGDGYGEAFRTSKNGDLPWVGKGPLEGSEERSRAKKGEKDAEIDSSLSEKAYSHEQAPSPTGPNVHNEPATGEEHMMASEGSPVGNESDRQEYSKQEEVREETAKQTGATSLPAIDQTMAEEATAADALADLDELAEDDGGALSEEISKAHAASEAAETQARESDGRERMLNGDDEGTAGDDPWANLQREYPIDEQQGRKEERPQRLPSFGHDEEVMEMGTDDSLQQREKGRNQQVEEEPAGHEIEEETAEFQGEEVMPEQQLAYEDVEELNDLRSEGSGA